ncbi:MULTISPECIES: LysR substrate-binding domain-containing protein [unclassified Roseateles]|uniref:LysR substrate-binding domain-containing protein n=1 Tax=unclassified Roseateles TaxID=2626991 RepID=UPI0006F9A24E|nr:MULTISPECIES: LysR substrate-binding domain-containing protein [unclassified Roseateles]KQW51263.1 LysR family transcriptional regulator [Pelomonas sp. Root405]KRA77495.1 LysR family transcriptional regulator [Pelomonas sp. Root662]
MNQPVRQRPLSVGPLRAFEAVARLLSFRAAADELSLTQSAISRQIQSLEEEIGCVLFLRGTRRVELSSDGAQLLPTAVAVLSKLDQAVRQIRRSRGRRVVNVSTFASFASLWLIPRMEAFQREHEDIDIRVSAYDRKVDLEDGEIDLALRYDDRPSVPADAVQLFEETLSPCVSPWYLQKPPAPLKKPADLAGHALAEEDDARPSAEFLSWRRWLTVQGQPDLQPRRWLYLNFTYQQVQAALTGQGVALARLPLVHEHVQRGELVEPFGKAGRLGCPFSYWLITGPNAARRPEVQQFADWVNQQAAITRDQLAGV